MLAQNKARKPRKHHLLSLFTIVAQIMLVVGPAVLANNSIAPRASMTRSFALWVKFVLCDARILILYSLFAGETTILTISHLFSLYGALHYCRQCLSDFDTVRNAVRMSNLAMETDFAVAQNVALLPTKARLTILIIHRSSPGPTDALFNQRSAQILLKFLAASMLCGVLLQTDP